jgi:hypothetical protein
MVLARKEGLTETDSGTVGLVMANRGKERTAKALGVILAGAAIGGLFWTPSWPENGRQEAAILPAPRVSVIDAAIEYQRSGRVIPGAELKGKALCLGGKCAVISGRKIGVGETVREARESLRRDQRSQRAQKPEPPRVLPAPR